MREQPPGWAEKLLARFAPGRLSDEIRGDLYELFVLDLQRNGWRSARRKYIVRSLGFITKNFFWKRSDGSLNNNYIQMTGNYFKMARRSLSANKGTTIINILGLVIGIASALVILSVIRFEESFDTFHTNKDSIHRLVRISGTDVLEYRSGIPYPVGDALKHEIPAITKLTQLDYLGGSNVDVMSTDGKTLKKFSENSGLAAIEPGFFEMFDFAGEPLRWIAGNPATSLTEPNSVVITKEIAEKYFGKENPIDQVLRFQKEIDMKITGVIDDFPANTDFPFKFMISYSSMKAIFGEERMNEWVSVNDSHQVFIYAPNISKEDLEAQFDVVHATHVGKDITDMRHFRLQPFSELHYDPRFGNFSGRTITHETLLALKIIVLFLLLAGCINYINLSTAQSTLRSKEIGLRKVMGSSQQHLVMQFLTETFVVVVLAATSAVILVLALMPSIQNLLSLRISYELTDPFIIGSIAAIVLLLTICSGLYPAFVISRFNPISALRNKFNNEKVAGMNLRKVLVVTQFTFTQILAVSTFIVITQMNFFQNVDMGFNRNAVIVNMPILDNQQEYLRPLKVELQTLPFVSGVSTSFTLPSGLERNRSSRTVGRPDAQTAPDYLSYEFYSIDDSYLDLYEIKLLAGRPLKESDTVGGAVLINETTMKNLQIGSPQEAIGQELKFGGGEKAVIAGVIGNFYSNSLKEGVDNMVATYKPKSYRWLSIRLDLKGDESMTAVLSDIERVWNAHYPEMFFKYQFFDENIRAFYQQEFKFSRLFQVFSMIFISIGCLGLYGLITFIANKKGKEIAVRKTLGATITNIIVMFSREYVVLIAVSFLLALPVVWYGINEWLSSFQNQIKLQWWMFVGPGVIVLILALLVVGTKSFNAARVNPVEKLKCE
ncbi:MAG TPA: ABC transporter permease [Cyclobacteriaceae bacterium]|nr:ABC transporter permease [Cyclobacteriaceae bacterium]